MIPETSPRTRSVGARDACLRQSRTSFCGGDAGAGRGRKAPRTFPEEDRGVGTERCPLWFRDLAGRAVARAGTNCS